MTLTISITRPSARRRSLAVSLADFAALWKQRRALANMPTERLSDLGLTRADAAREAARPFWD
ncbi:MAG: DUF1127 domain-containing protein, partial [Octadecabacter sp.]|nr:DUF1127 domain-containing protein [Octadecabacter sp.]